MSNEWPTHTEELSRKTTEQLEKWTKGFDAKKISRREYAIALSVLYDTTSGLIFEDLSRLISDIYKDVTRKK